MFNRKRRGLLITRLLVRDGDICRWCDLKLDRKIKDKLRADFVTIDHIVAISNGGADDIDNLRLMHNGCNGLKGNA